MFQVGILLCGALAMSLAAVSVGPLENKPDEFKLVEGCYVAALGRVIPYGETPAPPHKGCYQLLCSEDSVTTHTCGAARVQHPLKLVEDKTQPYPGCCPKP